ncbi:MAG: fasciclin domain-containing protein [Chitinophagaceae bacterium]|nr:MAG: fasciclin domain-containing protein [Chitinophagaceae bacterium]
MRLKTILSLLLISCLVIAGCKKWEEHNEVTNQDLEKTLLDEISQRSNLSKFYEYLKSTGLDKELASSKTYTVWAPTNDALQSLDPSIVSDTARLRQFVANHIAHQTYFTRNAQQPVRVAMLNGKQVNFSATKFDDATITTADKYMGNGVLQVIDKFAPAYPNAWELVNNTKTTFRQNAFVLTLTRKVFDPTNGIIDSISSSTGQPVYRPGTDSVLRNSFNTDVYDLQNEATQYTYFILTDAGLNTEVTKLTPYFKTSTQDSTTSLASFAVIKDLIVEGEYSITQLPAVLTSKYGVRIPIDKNKIVETRRMSNGVAYVISEVNFDKREKIPAVVVQGENYIRFLDASGNIATPRQNNTTAVFTRARISPTNQSFTDMFAYGHGMAGLSAQYRVNRLPSVKYKVYWVAPNDTLSLNGTIVPAAFTQRLAMGSRTATGINLLPTIAPLPPLNVKPLSYSEVYLGDYTQSAYGTLDMFLTNATSTTGEPGGNRMNLDYIRLVPDL